MVKDCQFGVSPVNYSDSDSDYTHIPCNLLNKAYMYNKYVAELVMGRAGYGPSLYGPSWLWAEFVMGRVCYGPRCPVTHVLV